MKFGKFSSKLHAVFCAGFLSAFLLALVSCGSTPEKEVVVSDDVLNLLPSDQFIPVIERNKDGLPELYVAQADPYSAQKGRVHKDAVVQFIEAKRQLNSGNYASAVNIAETLTEAHESLSGPWVILGDVAVKTEKWAEAEEHYKKALEVNRENVNAYLKLALLQRQQGDYLLAQNTYVSALSVWSDFPEAHLNLAILYDLYLNHPIRAQRHYEAYQFLTDGRDAHGEKWLSEIKNRTGLAFKLKVGDDQAPEVAVNE